MEKEKAKSCRICGKPLVLCVCGIAVKIVMETIKDLVLDFLVYDRKEDEDLPRGTIQLLCSVGDITIEDMVDQFEKSLTERLLPVRKKIDVKGRGWKDNWNIEPEPEKMKPEQIKQMIEAGRITTVVFMRRDIIRAINRRAKEHDISFSEELEGLIDGVFDQP